MNIALIFAGGSGIRMNSASKPKQFLQLYGKEIIIHTIEQFERHPEIDGIVVVCLDSWISFLKSLLGKFNITKARAVIPGGPIVQESIYNGLKAIDKQYPDDSVVVIHDGVRPIIGRDLISKCIKSVTDYGSAITVSPVIDTVVFLDNQGRIKTTTDRHACFHAKAPQCFKLSDILNCHIRARKERVPLENIENSALLMKYYGYELYTVPGSYDNIKITTPSDFYTFRALYEARENSQIFGLE